MAIDRRAVVPPLRHAPAPVATVRPEPAPEAPSEAAPQSVPLTIEAFVAERGEPLLRLAYLVTGNQADAEDLLQETLVDVHRKWDQVSRAEHPYAYVRTMLHNRFVSSRRRKWHGERPTDPVDITFLEQAVADPVGEVDARDAMWRLLETLPPRMRAVLVLRYFEDLDDAEIAETLGIGVSTVRANASRALRQLRTKGGAR